MVKRGGFLSLFQAPHYEKQDDEHLEIFPFFVFIVCICTDEHRCILKAKGSAWVTPLTGKELKQTLRYDYFVQEEINPGSNLIQVSPPKSGSVTGNKHSAKCLF